MVGLMHKDDPDGFPIFKINYLFSNENIDFIILFGVNRLPESSARMS